MINVYIKTFNRPFYLDRCIRSVKRMVSNYGSIIALDDGTLTVYKARIAELHPDVSIISSSADDEKYELLKQERFAEIMARYPDPARFWVDATKHDPNDYLLVLEDDMWMMKQIDLGAVEPLLRGYNTIALKLGWREDSQSGSGGTYEHRPLPGNAMEFYRSDYADMWETWLPCLMVLRKDYWLHCMTGLPNVNDESTQLVRAKQFILGSTVPVTHAKTTIRSAYQGWACPGRSDPSYYQFGIKQHLFMDSLNDTWFNGEFDVDEGLPLDFSREYLEKAFNGRSPVPTDQLELWRKWRDGAIWGNCGLYYNPEDIQ